MFMRIRKTNAWIEREGSTVRLISYRTLICEVHTDSKHVLLSPAARCSNTTIRHLSEFLNGFGISYLEVKPCLMDSSHETAIKTENDFLAYVSDDLRFKFKETQPFCLL